MLERTKSQQQGRKDSIVEKREIYSHLKNICFVKIGYLYLNIDFTEFLRKNGEHNLEITEFLCRKTFVKVIPSLICNLI